MRPAPAESLSAGGHRGCWRFPHSSGRTCTFYIRRGHSGRATFIVDIFLQRTCFNIPRKIILQGFLFCIFFRWDYRGPSMKISWSGFLQKSNLYG